MSYDRQETSLTDSEDYAVSSRAKPVKHFVYDDGVEYRRYTDDTGDETGHGGYQLPNYLSDEVIIEPKL